MDSGEISVEECPGDPNDIYPPEIAKLKESDPKILDKFMTAVA